MPRTNYPHPFLTLIQSTSYPPLPARDDLDSFRQLLSEQRTLPTQVKRKREESTPLPLSHINERRSPGVKVERSVSPAGSVISAVAPTTSTSIPPPPTALKASPAHGPITYGGIKKKKKRPLESDDDGMFHVA
jgi:hypothetical protein